MLPAILPGLLVVVVVAAVMALGVRPVLLRLPEPDEPDQRGEPAEPAALSETSELLPPRDDLPFSERDPAPEWPSEQPKTPYRDLARPGFVVGSAASAVLSTTVVVSVLPARLWPPWLVLCTVGVLLAWIDAFTTWLPWRLTWAGWLGTLAAGVVSIAVGATWLDLARLVACGLLAGLWYVLIYLLTRRRLGLGDVWLAPLVGAPAGLVDFTHLYLALLLGSVVGGVHGLVLLIRGHRGGFPYAPSIVAGPFLALILLRLLP